MKIKHIESQIETSIEFREWIREYVRKDIYNKWEVVNLKGVYKVYTVRDNGGSAITLMSYSEANKHKNQFSSKVRISKENVSMEFYRNYIETKILKNHLPLRKKYWYNLPNIKAKLEIIIKSKISKEAWLIIRGIAIIVIASIIIAALK